MAAEIGGMLAAGVLKAAAGKVAAAAGDRVMLQWRFGDDLEDMKDTMESIEAVLEDAERRSIVDASVRLWLKRLTRASYDISDMFDEFEGNASLISFIRKVAMASKMKKVRKKLENISNEHHKYSFLTSSNSNINQVISERETSPEVIESEILGRDQEKQIVIDLLMEASRSSEFIVLPIYGMGGIGKTTLVQLLFNDAHFDGYHKAWVYVSQTFDLTKIKNSVISQLQMKEDSEEQDAGPSARKNILIILDDLWEEDDFKLDDLKKSMKIVGNGHKVHVIVTTRDADIATKVQTVEAHKISDLSDDVCWTIIKSKVVGFEDRPDKESFESTGAKIAEKCVGVALAARAIGYLLGSKRDLVQWVSLNDSGIWNVSSPCDNVLASLKLSYSSMPPHLRLCFTYCAVFPKGHEMAKDELIYQWAALGFLKPPDGVSIGQHGQNCIKQLLEMSFFQHSKSPSFEGKHCKGVQLFTMHDLVHDLARLIMGDEFLDATTLCSIGRRNCRYAILAECCRPLNSFVTYPDKVRALHFLGSGGTGHCHSGLSTAKYLRVLDLAGCSLEIFPSIIAQVKLLRYLNAPGIKGREITACITKLSKLIFLNISGSRELLALPLSVGGMKSLMYLDLSDCSKIEKLPASFRKLKSLVQLDLSNCSRVNGIPEALCSLTKLQHLNLSFQERAPQFYPKKLLEVIGELIELRYLNLSSCLRYRYDGLLDRISALSNLEHLDLSHNGESVHTIPDSFCSLRKLHTLNLRSCKIIRLPEQMALMDSLKFLILFDCQSLDRSTLPINKSLIPLPIFVVYAAEGEQSSNLILLKDINLLELEISRLECVKSAEEARRIELGEKQSLVDLTLDWTRGAKRFVDDDMELLRELTPPSRLTSFQLRGYNGVSLPPWLINVHSYLPHLVRVELKGFSQYCSLPPLGQLSNLKMLHLAAIPSLTKIDRSFCGYSNKGFTKLYELTISDMENLEEWSTSYSCDEGAAEYFMFPNLERLEISACCKLRVSPCPPRVKKTWTIIDSDGVLMRWGESAPHTVCSTSSALVPTLKVKSCKAPMHRWKLLHHLPGLSELTIDKCSDLSMSPEITWFRNLTSLQCSGIHVLPEWLGDCASLNRLKIVDCTGITSLPCIQQLKNLESLEVIRCPELYEWCKQEGKTKIAHVTFIMLRAL